MHITVRFPVVEVDGTLVALHVGNPDAEFGDEVVLDAVTDARQLAPLYVASVDTAAISDLSAETLSLFGFRDHIDFLHALERSYGTGFNVTMPVTIYTLYDRPVEESAR